MKLAIINNFIGAVNCCSNRVKTELMEFVEFIIKYIIAIFKFVINFAGLFLRISLMFGGFVLLGFVLPFIVADQIGELTMLLTGNGTLASRAFAVTFCIELLIEAYKIEKLLK